jgi:hypothetical protein
MDMIGRDPNNLLYVVGTYTQPELKPVIERVAASAAVKLTMGKRNATRPTIVVVTMEGVEFSNRSYQQVVEAVKNSGATLHVLSIGIPRSAETQEMRDRNIALARATEESGGRRDQVLALSGLPDRMAQLARELTHQYVVTYGRPDTLIPPDKIDVGVTRPGITARARTQAPGK